MIFQKQHKRERNLLSLFVFLSFSIRFDKIYYEKQRKEAVRVATAINKCPICGSAVSISTEIPVRIHIDTNGHAEVVSKPKTLIQGVRNIVSRGYPYHPEVKCDKCDAELKVDINRNGAYEISTVKEMF